MLTMRIISVLFITTLAFSTLALAYEDDLQKINKIVVFPKSPATFLNSEATNSVSSELKNLGKYEVEIWQGNTSPRQRNEISKKLNADAILITDAKDGKKEGLYNVRLRIKLMDASSNKVLWSDVQDSRRLIGNYNRNIQDYMMYVNAVAKNVINNLREKLQRE
jgi:TolB-like protein